MGSHNFPDGLSIAPLSVPSGKEADVDHDNQQRWIQDFGIAGRTWEAAPYLADYLRPPSSNSLITYDPPCDIYERDRPPVVLELGSGNGYLGRLLVDWLPSGSSLILTDLEEVVPLLQSVLSPHDRQQVVRNVKVQVQPLAWGDDDQGRRILRSTSSSTTAEGESIEMGSGITHILCSDLVYFPHLLEPLLRTLLVLTDTPESGSTIQIIFSYKIRSLTKETPFWGAFGVYFHFEQIIRNTNDNDAHQHEISGRSDEDRLFLFRCHRRPGTSFSAAGLPIPSDIISKAEKTDDTFESILLMQTLDML